MLLDKREGWGRPVTVKSRNNNKTKKTNEHKSKSSRRRRGRSGRLKNDKEGGDKHDGRYPHQDRPFVAPLRLLRIDKTNKTNKTNQNKQNKQNQKHISMRLYIKDDADAVGEYCAEYIVQRVTAFQPTAEHPFVLGLPTGSTPLPTYKALVQLHKEGKVSFKHVVTFNMDEYVALPRDHPESYHSFMWENLFKHVDIDPKNVHILDGNAPNLMEECDAFERAITAHGGIELFLAGIGPDGHIAFNEPGSSLRSRTRVKTLAYDTILANARFFDHDLSKVPRMSLTVGVGTVMVNCRRVRCPLDFCLLVCVWRPGPQRDSVVFLVLAVSLILPSCPLAGACCCRVLSAFSSRD
eukprot:m.119395 g.119395  ORF g.119395 m.119395 type:complete len:352 (-) comp16466_c0_seq6:330-1385(-)